jgi:hypothetical protein
MTTKDTGMPGEIFVEPKDTPGDYGLRFTPDRSKTRYVHGDIADELRREIEQLEQICAESYQVLGAFMDYLPDAKALDNLSRQKRVHDDVLPFAPVGMESMRRENEVLREGLGYYAASNHFHRGLTPSCPDYYINDEGEVAQHALARADEIRGGEK